MNKLQRAIGWALKAIGFPVWNPANPMPGPYSAFFRGRNGAEVLKRLSTYYTCCSLLGRTTATLPIGVYESDGDISVSVESYINDVLKQPNEVMNKVVFLETMLLQFNVFGNAYAQIIRIGNRITALWPLPFERVRPRWDKGTLVYDVSLPDRSAPITLSINDVLHVRNMSLDGVTGLSPLQLQSVQRGMDAADFSDSYMQNRGMPSLVFSSDANPTPEAKDELRKTGDRLYAGPENAGRIIWAFGGMKVSSVSLSPADVQLIETMRMTDADIAAALGVPKYFINIGDTPTFASAEQFNRYFVDYGINPLCVRFATQFSEALINPRLNQTIKFNLDALLAGDSTARINYLRTAVAAGLMTANEARAKLNLKKKPGGDDLITQSNQAPLKLLEDMNTPPDQPPVSTPINGNKPQLTAPKQRYLPTWR